VTSQPILTDEVRAWARQAFPVRHVAVSEREIARFAYATGETDPVYYDAAAARAAGYPDVIAPPMFYVVLRVEPAYLGPRSHLNVDGSPREELPPVPYTSAVAGETRLDINRPIFAGETIACHKHVRDLVAKQGRSGPLLLLQFEYRYADSADETVVLEQFTRILR
jgi:hydroxyacyl-ACP dehydratase HTD2-like protein with hotdog domain